jgi:hypothetical protein
MISSLSSTRALYSLSRFSLSDYPSPSIVPAPNISSLRLSPLNATLSRTRQRPAARLGPAEDVSASEDATSALKTDEEALREQV